MNKLFFLLSILIVLSFLNPVSAEDVKNKASEKEPPKKIYRLYYDADKLFNAGKYQEAFDIMELVIKRYSGQKVQLATKLMQYESRLCDIAFFLEKYDTILSYSKKYISSSKLQERNFALNYAAEVFKRTGNYSQAIDYYKEAIKINAGEKNHNYLLYSFLGSVYYKDGDIENALIAYEKSLELTQKEFGTNHPQNITPLNAIGTINIQTSQFPKAKISFEKAYQICKQQYGDENKYTKKFHAILQKF